MAHGLGPCSYYWSLLRPLVFGGKITEQEIKSPIKVKNGKKNFNQLWGAAQHLQAGLKHPKAGRKTQQLLVYNHRSWEHVALPWLVCVSSEVSCETLGWTTCIHCWPIRGKNYQIFDCCKHSLKRLLQPSIHPSSQKHTWQLLSCPFKLNIIFSSPLSLYYHFLDSFSGL